MSGDRFARRLHAPLSARLLQEAQRAPYFQEATGIPAGLCNHAWLDDAIYIPDSEVAASRDAVEALAPPSDRGFLWDFATRCREAMNSLLQRAEQVAVAAGDGAGLLVQFDDWVDDYRRATAFIPVFRIIDQVLVSQMSEAEAAAFLAAGSRHETEETRERVALGEIARQLREEGDMSAEGGHASTLLSRHVKEFGWLRTRWYLGEPFTLDQARRRVTALVAIGNTPRIPAWPKASTESRHRDTQSLLDELAFLRSFRAEAINKAIWVARPLFEAIGRSLGLDYGEVVHMMSGETRDALRGRVPVDRQLLDRRQARFGTVLLDGDFLALAGDEVDRYAEANGFGRAATGDATSNVVLRGVTASGGRARGPVRVVHSAADDFKVQSGDVLVTTMTFPSLVGAMQRSAAIVTDDGGLLSHAAVTARELGKPCIIGTGNATEVLTDGDVVEVDTDGATITKVEGEQEK